MRITAAHSVAHCAPPPDLASLIEAIARRDRTALAHFYDQTHRPVFSLLCQMLGKHELAEAALLAVYQQVWQEAEPFERMRHKPLTWLILLARRHALAQRQTLVWEEPQQELPDLCHSLATGGATASETDPLNEERRQVQAALGQLRPEQRRAIELAFYNGLTDVEIAAQLGTSRDIVRARIGAGMRALKTSLKV